MTAHVNFRTKFCAPTQGGSAGRPERRATLKNIEKLRNMDADQLADFMVESGAAVPNDFCDISCTVEACKECSFCGPDGEKKAWKIWLESEYF